MSESSIWNKFFFDLAQAEYAAAREAEWIGGQFEGLETANISSRYQRIAHEETRHGDLMLRLCRSKDGYGSNASLEVLNGRWCCYPREAGSNALLERLILIHLVFEPSALAFLSYIYRHCSRHFEEQEIGRIRVSLGEILKDETAHIKESLDLIRFLWSEADADVRAKLFRSMDRHRAFIKAGVRATFSKSQELTLIAPDLLDRFDFSFIQTIKEVVHAS